MTPDINNNQNKNAQLFIMASLSPLVSKSLDLELYRANADPDESTLDFILTDAFNNLLKDCETIGVIFDVDASDYVEDMSALAHFLQLVELILPNGLYPLLKKDQSLCQMVRDILQGNVGDHGTVIQTYLTELAALDGGIPHRDHLVDAIDALYSSVSQTPVFTDYLKNLIELLDEERPIPNTDQERHIAYSAKARDLIVRMSDAVNLFEEDPTYPRLTQIQNVIIRDLLAADNFVEYAYLLLEGPDTLPEELVAGWMRKWQHYLVSHRWCWLYYTTRNIQEIDRAFQIMIACFTYARSVNVEEYKERMHAMRVMYPDAPLDNSIAAFYMVKV